MRKGLCILAALSIAVGALAACGEASPGGTQDKLKVGVILPDSTSAVRWESADRPYLQAAFDAAGVDSDIQNAQGSKQSFLTIADGMVNSGVDVLMIVNLDSGTGKTVLDKARQAGIKTIDYDRLTLNGGADYYVSFDNVKVGQLQAEGLVQCLTDKDVATPTIAFLHGSPTDNNASLLKEGYFGVLEPMFDSGEYIKGPEQDVPQWSGAEATTLFEGMWTSTGGKIDGVISANDTLGNAAITVLKREHVNGQVPVTGQDASPAGLQNILAGDQCVTVYKPIKKLADAAAELAIALAREETPAGLTTVKDTESGRDVPSRLEDPVKIFKDNVKQVVDDGFVTKEELCTGDFAALCEEAKI